MREYCSKGSQFVPAIVLALIGCILFLTPAYSEPLGVFDGTWTQIANDDGVGTNGYVNPGWGGQAFDAEYLYYKKTGNSLSIGLQTGFDLSDGKYSTGGKDYFAGDLGLSFDGDAAVYEYAFDFGLLTKDYHNHLVDAGSGTGIDTAGLYHVTAWNTDIYFHQSSPFAMDNGTLLAAVNGSTVLNSFSSGLTGEGLSYYRIVTFDLASLGTDFSGLDAHWTMSCGNDAIDGSAPAPVPEPSTSVLLGIGSGLLWLSRRRMTR